MYLVQGRYLEIRKRLLTIFESRHAPFIDYVGQIIDGKVKRIMEKLYNIKGVPRSGASAKQGREPKVNNKDPYQTNFMEKTDDVVRILLEKGSFLKK